jgi:hypothetical protein
VGRADCLETWEFQCPGNLWACNRSECGSLRISLSHRAFQFTIYSGPTNALVCNKALIQMSQTKTLKITPTYFDHQMIIIREIFDPG